VGDAPEKRRSLRSALFLCAKDFLWFYIGLKVSRNKLPCSAAGDEGKTLVGRETYVSLKAAEKEARCESDVVALATG